MDLWRYQIEIVALVFVVASVALAAMVGDYLAHHNRVGREQLREDRKAR